MENQALLRTSCEQMGVKLTDGMVRQFQTYLSLLLEWNQKMNLTAITEPKEVIQKHFVDCLSVLPYLQLQGRERMIDVGTGAGFPGIPIKIACPHLQLTLLDALQKRITFLETVTAQLALTDVFCVHSRAEDGGQHAAYREQFDVCVSRAVANLTVLAEYCLPFVRVGGRLAALKGPDAERETLEAKGALEKLGGTVERIIPVEIPFSDLRHTLVLIQKSVPTPKAYPRKAGKIAKKPLQ